MVALSLELRSDRLFMAALSREMKGSSIFMAALSLELRSDRLFMTALSCEMKGSAILWRRCPAR